MKHLKYNLLTLCFGALALAGCSSNDEAEHHFDNKLFVNVENPVEGLVFTSGQDETFTRTLTAAVALEAESEISGTFMIASSLVDTYNAIYSDSAKLLPTSCCTIENANVTIAKGAIESDEATVTFSSLGDLDSETTYVMPVELTNVSGIDLLQSKTNVYFIFKGASLINVVANISGNRAYPDWKDGSIFNNLTNFTLEALINADKLSKQISTVMGIEGNFLVRIGDAGVASNQIQIASNSNLTNADLQLETGKWYHLAVTFNRGTVIVYLNGVKKLEGSCGKGTVNFGAAHTNEDDGSRCFWIGYSYEAARYFDGQISEVRIWNKTLSADEINVENHFYTVDPDSEGLIAYWKFNEGSGKTIKDYSVNGNDLTADSDLTWINVELPETNK